MITTARILDAPVIKARLAAEQADMVFAVSDYVYEYVVRNCGGRVDPAAFEHAECQVKESKVSAWVRLAGRVAPPAQLAPPAHLAPSAAGPAPLAPPAASRPASPRPPTRPRCRSPRPWASCRPRSAAVKA